LAAIYAAELVQQLLIAGLSVTDAGDDKEFEASQRHRDGAVDQPKKGTTASAPGIKQVGYINRDISNRNT
jgi:hypothetical protein